MATTILTAQTLIVPAWLNIADIDLDYDEHEIVTFKNLPVSDLCLANGLSEGQFFCGFNGWRFLEDRTSEKAAALALIWMDRHTQGEYSRSRGFAPLRYEFAVASHINLTLRIPDDLDFSALNLHQRQPDEQPRFNDLALQLLCLANGIDFVLLSRGPVSDTTNLILSWYILHRRAGGATNPLLESTIQREAEAGLVYTQKAG